MKTEEELNAIKAEVESLSSKLSSLTEEELTMVSGGEEVSNPIIEGLIVAGLLAAAKIILSTIVPETEDEFIDWIYNHRDATDAIVYSTLSAFGLIIYSTLSWDKREQFWRRVYKMIQS